MTHRLQAPIFLICSERGGSNLITKIFDAHPQVCGPGTSHLFRLFADHGWRFGADRSALTGALLGMFRRKLGQWQLDATPDQALSALLSRGPSAAQGIAALYVAEARLAGKPICFIKENHAYRLLPVLFQASLRPRVLILLRDPRNMAASWQAAAALRGGAMRASAVWQRDTTGALQALGWLRGNLPVSLLRYEDLLAEPDQHLRRVCAELGLPFAPEMLDHARHSASAQADAGRARLWANLARPLTPEPPRKWAATLSSEQIAWVEHQCGSLMATLGYAQETDGASRANACGPELRRAVEAQEPWSKPAYATLPEAERARYEAWTQAYTALSERSAPSIRQ